MGQRAKINTDGEIGRVKDASNWGKKHLYIYPKSPPESFGSGKNNEQQNPKACKGNLLRESNSSRIPGKWGTRIGSSMYFLLKMGDVIPAIAM